MGGGGRTSEPAQRSRGTDQLSHGGSHSFQVIQVVWQGHLQPEPQQDPQLVMNHFRRNGRLDFLNNVDRRAARSMEKPGAASGPGAGSMRKASQSR